MFPNALATTDMFGNDDPFRYVDVLHRLHLVVPKCIKYNYFSGVRSYLLVVIPILFSGVPDRRVYLLNIQVTFYFSPVCKRIHVVHQQFCDG